MNDDLQKAYNIVCKVFGKRRYKIVKAIDKIKNKSIMVKICDFSQSIVLYYNNKNEDNVEEIINSFHFW